MFSALPSESPDPLFRPDRRIQETNRHGIGHIGAAWPGLAAAPPAAEEVGDDVIDVEILAEFEVPVFTASAALGEVTVEAALPGGLLTAGVDLPVIEALTLFRIAQDAVGLGDFLELMPRSPCCPG